MSQAAPSGSTLPDFAVLGDQPAELGEDQLGFDRFAQSLADRLLSSAQHTPFTVGVLGDWGQGKTTIMRMLQRYLSDRGCPTVWFEPWKYNDREGVWKGLALTLVREIRRNPSLLGEIHRKQEGLTRWLGGFLWSRLIGDTWGEKLIEAATSEPWSAASLHEMEKSLDELFKALDPGAGRLEGHPPLILFVDDLDRCLPEAARSVLEAVKLVLARKGLITVLGIAEGELSRAIHSAYAESMKGAGESLDPEWGRKYIRKIIQMPFPVPAITSQSFEDYVGHCLERSGVGARLGDRADWHPIIREACGSNLREVKRFLNHFISEMDKAAANAASLRESGRAPLADVTANPSRVAFVLLLAWRFREFYRHVHRRRDLLLRYQFVFTADMPEDQAAESLQDPDKEYHLDRDLVEFFVSCLRGQEDRAPLVPEFRDWNDVLPYLQFGMLPEEETAPEAEPEGPEQRQKAEELPPEPEEKEEKKKKEVKEARVEGRVTAEQEPDSEPERQPTAARAQPGPEAEAALEDAQSLMASGRYEEAETKLQRALRRVERTTDVAGQVALLNLLATSLQALGLRKRTVAVLEDSAQRAKSLRDPRLGLQTLVQLAEAHRRMGNPRGAVKAAEEATDLAHELVDPYGLSEALREKALALEGLDLHGKAQGLYERILDIAQDIAQPTLRAEALLRLGRNLSKQDKLEDAEANLQQALDLAREIHLADLEASALSALAEIQEERGHLEQAAVFHEKAKDLYKNVGNLEDEIAARLHLLSLRIELGAFDKAAPDLLMLHHKARENEALSERVLTDLTGLLRQRGSQDVMRVLDHAGSLAEGHGAGEDVQWIQQLRMALLVVEREKR